MKTIIYIIIAFFLFMSSAKCFSQERNIRHAPNGYIIFMGKEYPKNGVTYQLERKQKGKRYSILAEITSPNSPNVLKSNIEHFANQLGKKSSPNEALLDTLWENLQQDLEIQDYSTLDVTFQLAAGIAFYDATVEPDKAYSYRITKRTALLKKSKSKVLTTKKDIVTRDQEKPLYHSMSVSKNMINLKWYFFINTDISSFDVYRGKENSEKYEKIYAETFLLTKNDTLFLMVKDTTVNSFANYVYYTQIRDYCNYPSVKSEKVRATSGMANELALIDLNATPDPKTRSVKLVWNLPEPEIVNHVEIYKSTLFDGPYVKIAELNPRETQYVDNLHMAGAVFYYYALASTSFGKSLETAKEIVIFEGVDIPRTPSGLRIEGKENQVKLHWEGGEHFVRGYYVYRSTKPNEEMVQVSPFIPRSATMLSFIDSLPQPKGYTDYFYALRAESDGFIKSDYSDTVHYRLINTKVPMPNYINVRVDGNERFITWQGIKTEYDYLSKYLVYKNSKNGLELIGETSSVKNYYTDRTPVDNDTLQYAIRAVSYNDFQSNLLYSEKLVNANNLPAPPGDITAFISGESILLKWGYILGDDIRSIRVYRSDEQDSSVLVGEVDSNKLLFIDDNVVEGTLYLYTLTSINNKGIESMLSKEVILRK